MALIITIASLLLLACACLLFDMRNTIKENAEVTATIRGSVATMLKTFDMFIETYRKDMENMGNVILDVEISDGALIHDVKNHITESHKNLHQSIHDSYNAVNDQLEHLVPLLEDMEKKKNTEFINKVEDHLSNFYDTLNLIHSTLTDAATEQLLLQKQRYLAVRAMKADGQPISKIAKDMSLTASAVDNILKQGEKLFTIKETSNK